MPARSKAQRRFFGMVAAGIIPKPKGMTRADVEKFARTPEKGLPERKAAGGIVAGAGAGRGRRSRSR